ncbi:MAG TPA: hypothetical protein VMB22_04255 [Verrucomicrobiae bacterium]|nr:hypothetical protein [Verrucomicrobiae bacterium]
MNERADRENLLDDVLAEAAPADFREALLDETLRLARRRRQFRKIRYTATALVVLGLTAALFWQNWPKEPAVSLPLAKKTVRASYQLVRTQPLPAGAIVTTHPLAPGEFVASISAVRIVQDTAGNYRVINDAELLALVGQHPAVLIRTGPHSEELVFADLEDQKGFPLN